MEEERRSLRREEGTALVVVLLAIVILLPPTLVLSALALRWQRQSIDFRDGLVQEYVAEAGFEEARSRLSDERIGIEPGTATSFQVDGISGVPASVRISRSEDVVLGLDGRLLRGLDAGAIDLEQTGVDAEGRVVYQYRALQIYLVEVEVRRRPTLPEVLLHGVVARLPDGSLETLGVTLDRRFRDPSGKAKP